jgi:endonuclease-3
MPEGQVNAAPELREKAARVTARVRVEYGIDEPELEDDDPIGSLVGTILSQHTNDQNAHRAYELLRARYPTWHDVLAAPDAELADTIRIGGLANVKATRIKQCLAAIPDLDLSHLRNASLEVARRVLRELPGVGPKTAACVMLFNLALPAIPVDTHVHRVTRRLGLIGSNVSADAAHAVLEAMVAPGDAYAFHVGLVRHGRRICKAQRPLCGDCVLVDLCDYYLGPREGRGLASDSQPGVEGLDGRASREGPAGGS